MLAGADAIARIFTVGILTMTLHYETVAPRTLEILRILMKTYSLQDFVLVGGTALSLQWGHRISDDIDMFRFSTEEVDGTLIYEELENTFTDILELSRQNYYLKLLIEGIKIDLLRYKHPVIDEVLEIDGIRMLSPKDIVPMKLLAINNRGARKDFYDLYFMLNLFSLEELFGFYEQKFKTIDRFQLCKSLCYFDDADGSLSKLEPLTTISWQEAKSEIQKIARCV